MPFFLLIVILAILGLYMYAHFLRPPKQQVIFPQLQKPFIFAHQGGEALAPTNTMAAFKVADGLFTNRPDLLKEVRQEMA